MEMYNTVQVYICVFYMAKLVTPIADMGIFIP